MKMPSTGVLFGIGAAVVVVLVVISKLRGSNSSTTTTATAPASAATGVDVGSLSAFEGDVTSQLDAWEAQQASANTTASTSAASTSTSSTASSTSPLPSTGTVAVSTPAPVVTSAPQLLPLRTLSQIENEDQLLGNPYSVQVDDLSPSYLVASERQAAKQGISLQQAYEEEVTNSVPGWV